MQFGGPQSERKLNLPLRTPALFPFTPSPQHTITTQLFPLIEGGLPTYPHATPAGFRRRFCCQKSTRSAAAKTQRRKQSGMSPWETTKRTWWWKLKALELRDAAIYKATEHIGSLEAEGKETIREEIYPRFRQLAEEGLQKTHHREKNTLSEYHGVGIQCESSFISVLSCSYHLTKWMEGEVGQSQYSTSGRHG